MLGYGGEETDGEGIGYAGRTDRAATITLVGRP